MGLFNKLFKKEGEVQESTNIKNSLHKENWDFYTSSLNDIKSSILIDLGLWEVAPVDNMTYLVQISLTMNEPAEDGLSSDSEFEKLKKIEDRLKSSFSQRNDSIYIGRLTWNKQRFFYFYIKDSAFYEKTISDALAEFKDYNYEMGINEDSSWGTYFDFLYPNPLQYQIIQNRKIIRHLESEGDSLEKERRIDHWLYFKTENDRINFIKEIEEDEFEIVGLSENPKLNNPFQLWINRIEYLDLKSINDITSFLFILAEENNGEYDGWEVSVENN